MELINRIQTEAILEIWHNFKVLFSISETTTNILLMRQNHCTATFANP